ncbi:MAG: hypothetical protein Hyperionvirus4_125 [Hyperionvirus sp.]|uniref:Uncharacterized protein n=1 Tax=Hyperionvirus sp. TaxID=2487770 RepID=A0A3G5A7C1_9VIRU|nr:MAG: hypothetical protein Hyperionvirus4_125 [Hyperionvirus sp.]
MATGDTDEVKVSTVESKTYLFWEEKEKKWGEKSYLGGLTCEGEDCVDAGDVCDPEYVRGVDSFIPDDEEMKTVFLCGWCARKDPVLKDIFPKWDGDIEQELRARDNKIGGEYREDGHHAFVMGCLDNVMAHYFDKPQFYGEFHSRYSYRDKDGMDEVTIKGKFYVKSIYNAAMRFAEHHNMCIPGEPCDGRCMADKNYCGCGCDEL